MWYPKRGKVHSGKLLVFGWNERFQTMSSHALLKKHADLVPLESTWNYRYTRESLEHWANSYLGSSVCFTSVGRVNTIVTRLYFWCTLGLLPASLEFNGGSAQRCLLKRCELESVFHLPFGWRNDEFDSLFLCCSEYLFHGKLFNEVRQILEELLFTFWTISRLGSRV